MKGEGTIDIKVRFDDQFVTVDIIDSGPGVDPDLRDDLFVPFVSKDDLNRGMGLGLSICKRIVESFGGMIGYQDDEGRTDFSVRLPVEEDTRA